MSLAVRPLAKTSLPAQLQAAPFPWAVSVIQLTIASLSFHGITCSIPAEYASSIRHFVLEVVVVEALIILHASVRGQRVAQLFSLVASLIKINACVFSLACFFGIVHRTLTTAADGTAGIPPDMALALGLLHSAFALPWWPRSGEAAAAAEAKGQKGRQLLDVPLPVHRVPRVNKKIRQPVRHLPGKHQIYVGTVKHFIPEREIGFVEPETGEFWEDLYFKVSALSMELQLLGKGMEGQRVDFVVVYRDTGRAHIRAAVPHVER